MSSRGGNTHWCYQCQQPVRPLGDSMLCPRCDGGFVQELDELGGGVGVGAGGGSYGYRDSHGPDDLLGIMDALESLMLRNSPEHRLRLMEALMRQRRRHGVDSDPRSYNPEHALALLEPLDVLRRQRRRRYGSDSEHPGSPWLIFQGQMPSRASRSPSAGGLEMILNGSPGVGFTRGSSDDYFVGPGLQELVEELMERLVTDRQGPPPAPRSAIDAMPTIKITRAHLQTDSHCPVCKDRFELGTEVRQMPCNHIYHSDCIVPWLVQHNSCPVCRHVMGSAPPSRGQSPTSGGSRSGSSNARGTSESGDQTHGRRNPFSFLWPFRSSSTNTNTAREYAGTGGGSPAVPATTTTAAATPTATATATITAPHEENHEMHYSGWPFDY